MENLEGTEFGWNLKNLREIEMRSHGHDEFIYV